MPLDDFRPRSKPSVNHYNNERLTHVMLPKITKPVGLAAAIIACLAALEVGVALWRLNVPVSTAPVFYWKDAPLLTTAPPPFGRALELYRADRGAEQTQELPNGRKMTIFYFEWDQLKINPVMNLALHAPEVCNSIAGFKLLEVLPNRSYQASGQEPLAFDCTHFTGPTGRDVYIFKMVWMQGYGCLRMREEGPGAAPLQEGAHRFARLKNSFVRHSGAGRIVEAAVFNASDAEQAWQTFREQALDRIIWQ
jgi:hypothetical protein